MCSVMSGRYTKYHYYYSAHRANQFRLTSAELLVQGESTVPTSKENFTKALGTVIALDFRILITLLNLYVYLLTILLEGAKSSSPELLSVGREINFFLYCPFSKHFTPRRRSYLSNGYQCCQATLILVFLVLHLLIHDMNSSSLLIIWPN